MPVIAAKILKGRSIEKKRAMVEALTEAAASTLDLSRDAVTVLIEEFDRENWAHAGKLRSDE